MRERDGLRQIMGYQAFYMTVTDTRFASILDDVLLFLNPSSGQLPPRPDRCFYGRRSPAMVMLRQE